MSGAPFTASGNRCSFFLLLLSRFQFHFCSLLSRVLSSLFSFSLFIPAPCSIFCCTWRGKSTNIDAWSIVLSNYNVLHHFLFLFLFIFYSVPFLPLPSPSPYILLFILPYVPLPSLSSSFLSPTPISNPPLLLLPSFLTPSCTYSITILTPLHLALLPHTLASPHLLDN